MKKTTLTLAIVAATLWAASAYAQAQGPGEDKAVPAEKATATEKAAAKAARKSAGAQTAKSTKSHADADPSSAGGARLTKAERKAAAVKRKAAGAKAVKEPKDASGPAS